MHKTIHIFENIKEKIIHAVDTISDPVRGTISPKGRNCLFQDDKGNIYSTNDGATIVKNISVKDPIENAIIDIVKASSLKTNSEVGDGTSTSILLSQILVKEGLKLVESGYNPMELKEKFNEFAEKLIKSLKVQAIKIKNDKDLFNIAKISANNDEKIAKEVVQVIKVAGTDGMIFLEPGSEETEIIEDTGFIINTGLLAPELKNDPSRFVATYKNVPVFITDKRLYYKAEAESIMSTVLLAGYKQVIIVARDFLGESLTSFMGNHLQGKISLLLIKDSTATEQKADTLHDLADYLGGKVIMEKNGDMVGKITIKDFVIADKVFQDPIKSILTTKNPDSKTLKNKISAIRTELKADKDNKDLKKRLACLTNGMVTVKIGGRTGIEQTENMYRYEDSIHATRAAIKDGYLVGGGIAILNAFYDNLHWFDTELVPTFKKFCQGNVRQIALNCGKHPEFILEQIRNDKNKNTGYNAMTDKIEDLLKMGVVDPFKVTENAVNNSVSITNQIISSNFLIVNDLEEED